MTDRNTRVLVTTLKESGADDISIRNGKHHILFFSFLFRVPRRLQIVISKTPSDRNARKKVASDIRRECRRLGMEPPMMANYCRIPLFDVIAWLLRGYRSEPVP